MDFLAPYHQIAPTDFHGCFRATMNRIIAHQVSQLLWVTEIIDPQYLNVYSALDNASHHHTTNTTKPIDSNFDSHIPILPKEVAVAIGEALTISVLLSP